MAFIVCNVHECTFPIFNYNPLMYYTHTSSELCLVSMYVQVQYIYVTQNACKPKESSTYLLSYNIPYSVELVNTKLTYLPNIIPMVNPKPKFRQLPYL